MSMELTRMTRLPSAKDELVEEALSEIFECFENDLRKVEQIEPILNAKIEPNILEELKKQRLVAVSNGQVEWSNPAQEIGREVIRRKRLAERLLKDILNVSEEDIDPAACQWEHILSKQVTNSICTLLGHPTQSPRSFPIPEGECCRTAARAVAPVVCSLEKLERGRKGKIVYLLLKENPELQRLLSLGLVPGTEVDIIQRFPTYVVQVGESQLAFDSGIAEAIFVHPL